MSDNRKLSQEELVFFVLDSDAVLRIPGALTTDGNAASNETEIFVGSGALPHLNWSILETTNCYSKDYKRMKCAEVLVPDRILPKYFRRISTFNEKAASRLKARLTLMCRRANRSRKIVDRISADPSLYYVERNER